MVQIDIPKDSGFEKDLESLNKEVPSLLFQQAKELDNLVKQVLKVANMELAGEPIEGPALINFNRLRTIMVTCIDDCLDSLEGRIDQQGDMVEGICERVEHLIQNTLMVGEEESLEIKELVKALNKEVEEGVSFVEEMKETITSAVSDFSESFKEVKSSSKELPVFEEGEEE